MLRFCFDSYSTSSSKASGAAFTVDLGGVSSSHSVVFLKQRLKSVSQVAGVSRMTDPRRPSHNDSPRFGALLSDAMNSGMPIN